MWQNATTVSGSEESGTVVGLNPETIYNVTVYSANKYGVGQRKSSALQVETRKGIPYKMYELLPQKLIYTYI